MSSREERVAIKNVLWDLLGRKVLRELSPLSSLEGEGKGRGTQILPPDQSWHGCNLRLHWTYLVKLCVVASCNDWVSNTYFLLEISPS